MTDPETRSAAPATVRYRQIVEEALVGVYVSTPAGRLVFCNPAMARLLGFGSVEEALGTPLTALYEAPAAREAFVERVRAFRRLEPQRMQLHRRDGRRVEVLETVVGEFDERGELVELRGQVIDFTETVATEETLRNSEQQFRAVFNDAADAILMLDDRRAVLEANPAATRLFSLNGHASRLDDLLGDREGLAVLWTDLLARGEVSHEHRVDAGPNAGHIVECSYRARVHAGRHLCIARDITERRLLEERLVQSQKIETVGRLAGGIAHDFNNLLTAMIGYTELLLANHGPGDPERADLEEIHRAGQRAAALTHQLLAFSRKQVLVPKQVDLNEALNAVRGMLARLIREDLRLVVSTAPEPATVRIDPNQFEQVVMNLVLNARDALPAGGDIVLAIEQKRVAGGRGDDGRVPAGDYVVLRVADNGIGITAEARAHLFEPFFTTKEFGKGTGLGLASVYGIVRQSNGYITVDSEPGRGSTFSVYLPAVAGSHEAEQTPPVSAGQSDGETILLVEDEDAVRVIVSELLRRSGYNVLEASTPRGACEIFAQHGGEIDLLLTDVVMPEMNGPSLAQRLVAEQPDLRVLFISGYTDVAGPFASENPNIDFLSKPFQGAVLIERVRALLARRRSGVGPVLR